MKTKNCTSNCKQYIEDYKNIFCYAAALLAECIHNQSIFIEQRMKERNSASYDFIKLTADNLCAYNEMFPESTFVRIRAFLTY